jgi:hypothetical protein
MIKYDVYYYYNLLRIHTHTAKEICDIRWKFIEENIPSIPFMASRSISPNILDYGCGVGWFSAFKPSYIKDKDMDTFDIMPVPQTGIRHDKYDLLTMWDVLEHIPDFTELAPLLKNTDYVTISIPIKPIGVFWDNWKHFKPGEHLHYYSVELLEALFKTYNFSVLVDAKPECPPREDIHSIIFKKDGL